MGFEVVPIGELHFDSHPLRNPNHRGNAVKKEDARGHGLYSCALCGLRGVGLLPGTDGSIVAEATGRNPAIASRGIDVDDITLVINFDMPIDPELYVHRVSRTARAGASGAAVSFCDLDERGQLPAGVRIESRFSRRFRRSKAGGRSR